MGNEATQLEATKGAVKEPVKMTSDELMREVLKERETKKPDESESTPSDQKPDEDVKPSETPKSDEKPEEKPQPEAEPKKEEAPEEKPEEKPDAKPDAKPEPKPYDEKFVQEWAIKHSMTLDEAKDDLEKNKGLIGKYQSPEEMARAMRTLQREHEALKKEAGDKEDQYQISSNPRLDVYNWLRNNQEQALTEYKAQYPARTRDMEDDAILEEIADKLLVGYSQWNESRKEILKKDASKRRDELLTSIKESDRRFIPDIKAVLDKTSDRVIVGRDFNLNDVVRWAKGADYDRAVKEAEERGRKQAEEKPRILGTLPTPKTESHTPSKKTMVSLTPWEKKEALRMYGGTTMTEDEKYQEYYDVFKKKKKEGDKK